MARDLRGRRPIALAEALIHMREKIESIILGSALSTRTLHARYQNVAAAIGHRMN